MEIVNVKNIQKVYKNGVKALDNISFQVAEGEFVSIIGPSGAGKTSLLRMINGAIYPTSGDIYLKLDEEDLHIESKAVAINQVRGMPKRKLQKQIGTIYQDFCLVDQLSCLQNVLNAELADVNTFRALFGIFTKEQRARALQALAAVGIEDKCDIPACELSGGQKQRVAIARAIMQKSKLLLADEPVASLDPYTSKQILSLVQNLQKKYGLTVIMNSHNVDAALQYSDRIIGISNGMVVLDKAVSDITEKDIDLVYAKSADVEESNER